MTLTCTNVTLRQKPLRNDRISLYLDYYPAIRNPYTMKMSRREFLGIYIYAKPKNEQQRMFNQDMLNKAEAIRCIRVQSLINEEFGFLDKNKQKVDFLAYFRTKAREKYEKWDCVYNHFEKFVGGKCTFGDVTVELCEKFRDYLLKCKQINHPNAYISRNSAAGYYSTFRALLKIAYKEKMLRENLNDFLEKIEWKEVKKEYLTLDEVKKLAATPCKIPVLKQASLFACMTGLRISDILKLDWHDFEVGPDQGYYIRICTEKTETEATLPISQEALELCGEWGTGKVFKGLTRSMTHHPLKQWIAEAGIRKHITFHTARQAILTELGVDIQCSSMRENSQYFIANQEELENNEVLNWLTDSMATESLLLENKAISDKIVLEPVPGGREWLPVLSQALRDNLRIVFQYTSFHSTKNNLSDRILEPLCLKLFKRRWYMLGQTVDSGKRLIFALDRITKLELSSEQFTYPEDFSAKDFFANFYGICSDGYSTPTRVILKCYREFPKYVKSLPLHPSQEELEHGDGFITFGYYMSPAYDFIQEIMSHGDDIEVLTPIWLRNLIKEKSDSLAALYK